MIVTCQSCQSRADFPPADGLPEDIGIKLAAKRANWRHKPDGAALCPRCGKADKRERRASNPGPTAEETRNAGKRQRRRENRRRGAVGGAVAFTPPSRPS